MSRDLPLDLPRRRRLVAGRFALALAAATFVVGSLEAPAALIGFDWRRVFLSQDQAFLGRMKPWTNPWSVPDAELLYRRPPHSHVAGKARGDCAPWLGIAHAREYSYDVLYDGRGYRNRRELAAATVAVVGDSFVEAALVPDDELMTSRLERALGVPVVNLGVGGYGPQQELAVVKRDALPLGPKLLLWCLFEGNDLLDVRRVERSLREGQGAKPDFATRSFTANAARFVARLFEKPLTEDSVEARRSSGVLRIDGADRGTKIYFPYPAEPLSDEDAASLDVVEGLLAEAARACADRKCELVVVFVPEKFRIYRELCDWPTDGHGRTWQPSDLPERLAAWARERAVSFVDLTPALRRAADGGELVYFADDGHWNGRGHAVVAAELEKAVRPRLPPEPGR